jgi:alkylated DNA nucleotide flippase Atl1
MSSFWAPGPSVTYRWRMPTSDMPVYRPAPIPRAASAVARGIIDIANLVPPARWTTYGDLAEAAGSSPRGVASALSSVTPLAKTTDDVRLDMAHWVVPWHRIRMNDGRLRSREAGASIRERQAFANALFVSEGGRLVGNQAAAVGQRFMLPAELRRLRARGEWPS